MTWQGKHGMTTQWFALRIASRGEFRADEELALAGIERFTPTFRRRTLVRYTKGREKTVELPLLPGYIFARLDHPDFFRTSRKRGAFDIQSEDRHYLVPEGEEPVCKHVIDVVRSTNGNAAPVRSAELRQLRLLCDAGAFDQGRARGQDNRFREGDTVRITGGPLAGISASFRETCGGMRPRAGFVRVVLDRLFGQVNFNVDVPRELVEAA